MPEFLRVGDDFPSSHFFQAHSGSEFSVVESLRANGHRLLFKAMGQYDIISFLDTDSPDNPRLYTSCHGIRTTRAVIGYRLCIGGYESPKITDWLAGTPVAGFVFLEIDKWLYTPEAGAQSGIEACITIVNKILQLASEQKLQVALYGGFGRSELYAVVRTNRLEDIWTFTTICRNLICKQCITECGTDDQDLPVFSRTETIPGISYDNISDVDGRITVNNVMGNSKAYITLKCPSGFENYIREYFPPTSDYLTDGLLGNNDVIIYTSKSIDSAKLIADILNFRRNWERKTGAPITTTTSIVDLSDAKNRANVSIYPLNTSLTSKIIVPSLAKNAPRLANRITTFFHYISSCSSIRSNHAGIQQIRSYSDYIQQLLSEYQAEHDSMPEINQYVSESALLEAIETAEIGLAQRIDTNFDSMRFDHLTLPFGDGIFSSLIALEYLINYVFTTWSSNTPGYTKERNCIGFPAFSDSFGFQLRWGETIFLPIEAIYNPISSSGSWRTLSHEISHAIYLRLEVATIQRQSYDELKALSFPSRALGINAPVEDQLNELFAHWYDYYHFYDCVIGNYLGGIWPSWLKLPIVHQNFSEYFFRSFSIYLMNDMSNTIDASKSGTDERTIFFDTAWKNHIEALRALKLGIPEEYIESIALKKMHICDLFLRYFPILYLFHYCYRNDTFRTALNKGSADLDTHLKRLCNGEVILGEIGNPYLLVRCLIENMGGKTDFRTSLALILSLKNRKWFYTYESVSDVDDNDA